MFVAIDTGVDTSESKQNPEESCPMNFQSLFSMLSGEGMSEPERDPHKPIYSGFQLPIEYLDKSTVFEVSDVVAADLELCPPQIDVDLSGNARTTKSMYEHLCQPQNRFSRQMIREIHKKYTTDMDFLEDTQSVLENTGKYLEHVAEFTRREIPGFLPDYDKFMAIWQETKEDAGFMDRYSFMDWPMFEYLNHSTEFLQTLSIINILSPVFSLLIPFLFLLFPFVLLKMRGIEITFDQYLDTLRDISKNHFIGKALNLRLDIESIVYFLFTAGLYFLQTYQNVKSCQRYYTNITKMNDHLVYMKQYVGLSIFRMKTFLFVNEQKSYKGFSDTVAEHLKKLEVLAEELARITPFCYSVSKCTSVGYMLRCYYHIHSNPEYESAIRYAVGFDAYMDNITGVYQNIRNGYLGKARFVEDSEAVFESQYYPPHQNYSRHVDKPTGDLVSNHCDLSRNMIITGVNASGKTTFLKTTAINVLVSQQFGFGFYRECSLHPYTHIHSYLNIPDTSGRDSLFQAESRRCKEIIDIIESTTDLSETEIDLKPKARHFCIFDELYSGTNPDEATQSATSLLKYLSKFPNVRFMLTTHYVSVCRKFRKSDTVQNYKMCVKVSPDGSIRYLYRLKKGISKIRGGMEILKQMNYPAEILRDIKDSTKPSSKTTK